MDGHILISNVQALNELGASYCAVFKNLPVKVEIEARADHLEVKFVWGTQYESKLWYSDTKLSKTDNSPMWQ